MKTSISSESRWSCRLVRSARAILGDKIGTDHVDQCADCQVFFCAGDELDSLLRHDARLQRAAVPIPAGLDQRILRGMRLEFAVVKQEAYGRLMAFGGTLAGAAILALLFVARPPANPTSPLVHAHPATATAKDAATENRWSAIVPQVEVLKANPLQDEVNLVYSDAKSALNFLALNFLPDRVRGSE